MVSGVNSGEVQQSDPIQEQSSGTGDNRSLLGGVVRGVGNMTRTAVGLGVGLAMTIGQAQGQETDGLASGTAMEFITNNWKPIVLCAGGAIAVALATTICWASCCCMPENNGYQPLEGTDSPEPENPKPENPTVRDHIQMLKRQAEQVVSGFVEKMERGEQAYHALWNSLIPVEEELSLMVTIPDTILGNPELDTLVNVDYGRIFGQFVDDCLARELGSIAFKAAKASYEAEVGHPRYDLSVPEMSELKNFFDTHTNLVVEVRQPSFMCDPNRIV